MATASSMGVRTDTLLSYPQHADVLCQLIIDPHPIPEENRRRYIIRRRSTSLEFPRNWTTENDEVVLSLTRRYIAHDIMGIGTYVLYARCALHLCQCMEWSVF